MNVKTLLTIANSAHILNISMLTIGYFIFILQSSLLMIGISTFIYLLMLFVLEKIRQDVSFIQKKDSFWKNITHYHAIIPKNISSIKLIEQMFLYILTTIVPLLLIFYVAFSHVTYAVMEQQSNNTSIENMIDKEE